MEKKGNVVFCGLIRNIELFKKSIEEMAELRDRNFVDKIILST